MVGSIAGVLRNMLALQEEVAERLPLQIHLLLQQLPFLLLMLHHVQDLLQHGRDLAWARGLEHLGGLELLHGRELWLLPGQRHGRELRLLPGPLHGRELRLLLPGQQPHELRQRQGRPRLLQRWQRLPRREARLQRLQRLLMRGHRLHRLGHRLQRLGHRLLRYPQRYIAGGNIPPGILPRGQGLGGRVQQ